MTKDNNFLQEKSDGISANRSAGNNEIQISVDLPHENFGIREVDHHSDLRANLNRNIINIEESTLNPEFLPLELEKYQNENSSISKIQESGSDESEASEPDQGIGNHNCILALTTIEISCDTFVACIGNNDGWEFVTVNSREENTRQPGSLENSNFGDQSGSSPSAHFKHPMRVESTPHEDSNFSKPDGGNTPPSNDLVKIPEDILRGSKRKHGQWLLETLRSDKPILEYRRSLIKRAHYGMITTKYCGGIPTGFCVPMAGEYEEIDKSERQKQNRYKVSYRNHKYFIGLSEYRKGCHVGSFINTPLRTCVRGDKHYLKELTNRSTSQDLTKSNFRLVDNGDYPHAVCIRAVPEGEGTELLNGYSRSHPIEKNRQRRN